MLFVTQHNIIVITASDAPDIVVCDDAFTTGIDASYFGQRNGAASAAKTSELWTTGNATIQSVRILEGEVINMFIYIYKIIQHHMV